MSWLRWLVSRNLSFDLFYVTVDDDTNFCLISHYMGPTGLACYKRGHIAGFFEECNDYEPITQYHILAALNEKSNVKKLKECNHFPI